MDPLYTCDFCLKLFIEDHLERCCNCGEIYCIKCVPEKHIKTLINGEDKLHFQQDSLHYCTEVCMKEDTSMTGNL
jgi:hypothetical protein